jgi:hypothetical protein
MPPGERRLGTGDAAAAGTAATAAATAVDEESCGSPARRWCCAGEGDESDCGVASPSPLCSLSGVAGRGCGVPRRSRGRGALMLAPPVGTEKQSGAAAVRHTDGTEGATRPQFTTPSAFCTPRFPLSFVCSPFRGCCCCWPRLPTEPTDTLAQERGQQRATQGRGGEGTKGKGKGWAQVCIDCSIPLRRRLVLHSANGRGWSEWGRTGIHAAATGQGRSRAGRAVLGEQGMLQRWRGSTRSIQTAAANCSHTAASWSLTDAPGALPEPSNTAPADMCSAVCVQAGVSCLDRAHRPSPPPAMSRANYHNVTLSGQHTPTRRTREQQRWTMARRTESDLN